MNPINEKKKCHKKRKRLSRLGTGYVQGPHTHEAQQAQGLGPMMFLRDPQRCFNFNFFKTQEENMNIIIHILGWVFL